MPATTSPDNIVYPVAGDKVAPLRGWFSQLASSVQAALTALRAEAVKPVPPAPISVRGADVQNVTATAWADLPGISAATLTLSAPCWVQITAGAWIVATQADTRVSVSVSGATTLSETQLEVGGDSSAWGQVMYISASSVTAGGVATRIVRLNAGVNTIKVRAFKSGGSGVNQANYSTLQVAPLYWA